MADTTQQPADLLASVLAGFKLNVGGTLPGEMLLVAGFDFARTVRLTMSPDLMKRLDAVLVQQLEDLQAVWRSLWVKAGIVKA